MSCIRWRMHKSPGLCCRFEAKSSQFLPHLSVWLYLQFAQMPTSRDLAIFVTTDNYFTHAHGGNHIECRHIPETHNDHYQQHQYALFWLAARSQFNAMRERDWDTKAFLLTFIWDNRVQLYQDWSTAARDLLVWDWICTCTNNVRIFLCRIKV